MSGSGYAVFEVGGPDSRSVYLSLWRTTSEESEILTMTWAQGPTGSDLLEVDYFQNSTVGLWSWLQPDDGPRRNPDMHTTDLVTRQAHGQVGDLHQDHSGVTGEDWLVEIWIAGRTSRTRVGYRKGGETRHVLHTPTIIVLGSMPR